MAAGEFNELVKQGKYELGSWIILAVNTGRLRKFPV